MTKAELLDLIASEFPDNSTKLITPGRLRNVVNQMVDDMYPDGFDTHLILKNVRNFSTNPLNDGDSFTVATIMPEGKRLKDLWAKGTGISGSGSPILTFTIEDDAPDFHSIEPGSIDYNGSYSQISITPETTIENRNIIITVTGGDITDGTFDELVCEYIK